MIAACATQLYLKGAGDHASSLSSWVQLANAPVSGTIVIAGTLILSINSAASVSFAGGSCTAHARCTDFMCQLEIELRILIFLRD